MTLVDLDCRSAVGTGHDDLDLIRDPADPDYPRDGREGGVALGLTLDLALEGQPAIGDMHVDHVRRHVVVGHQSLQRSTARFVIEEAISWIDTQLVHDIPHTPYGLRDLHGDSTLMHARHGSSHGQRAPPRGHRYLWGVREAGIAV